ncbi:DUF6895 family protein [Actinokineospora diospyrosa]|uniref:DUF6895 domain-containing protein n=1 Tax=Actinokineospora diospyrosa TaxID=103728 RepID=A0ABT1IFZ5_9PSEU|nr:hypothetical protein [Actinokineospora diospyrosa]MCP2271569.1 hypothetical protein [Actinokineospora diospyrosa]
MKQIDWLTDNLAWFDPAVWDEFLPARPFPGGPLLELLLLCDTVDCGPLTGRALELADRITATDRFRAGLYRGDALFTYHVWLLALMGRLGAPSPLLGSAQALLHAGIRPPLDGVAALEARYANDLAGLRSPHLPPLGHLYRRWREGQHLDPLRMVGPECYALTHAVFYVTGFGRVPLPPDAELDRTARLLAAAHLATGDHDLGAELFHTALLAGGPAGLAPAHHRLTRAVDPDGYVAGPLHNPSILAKLTGRKTQAYRFGTGYHTTLVTALALAAWPAHPPTGRAVDELSTALVLAVRDRDLSRTASLLLTAAAANKNDPTIVAATTYLRSQRQPDGSFGIPADPDLTATCVAALAAVHRN